MQVDLDEPLCAAAVRRYAKGLVSFQASGSSWVLVNSTSNPLPCTLQSKKKPVRLGLRIPSDDPPRSPSELSQLEAAHTVCDLYSWLACRFSREFTDLEAAEACSDRAQRLISEGIRLLGTSALKNKRDGGLKRRDRSSRASHGGSNGSGKPHHAKKERHRGRGAR
jgi:hypothetical protein